MTDVSDFDFGPAALGRGAIVEPGGELGAALARHWNADPVRVDDDVLADPTEAVGRLHADWAHRKRVVVELAVDREALREREATEVEPFELDPNFEFERERLYFLVRENNYDFRGDAPLWGPALEAARLGAQVGGSGDVVTPDGAAVYCDGGPRGPVDGFDGAILHRVAIRSGLLDRDHDVGPDDAAQLDLADDQQSAVFHEAGPARIIAPAGSGKTRVLTSRLRHLVDERGWSPLTVTALAYNKRAAQEMRARLGGGHLGSTVRTLHSLGYSILRRTINKGPATIDAFEARKRLERLVPVRPRANVDVLAPYVEACATVRLGLIDPEIVEASSDELEGFAQAFGRYRDRLYDDGVVDFDEHIYGALTTLLRDPATRSVVQSECRHLLVDEFQDLTAAQMLFVRLISAPAYDVFGVGDDDQTIYGYQGADPRYLIDFARYFPGAKCRALATNYRCAPAIVRAASNVLSYNDIRIDKEIKPGRPESSDTDAGAESGRAVTVCSSRLADQSRLACDQIVAWRVDGIPNAKLACLARVNALLLPVQVALVLAEVPATRVVGPEVLNRTGIAAVLAYLRIADAVAAGATIRRADIFSTIRRPSRRIPRDVVGSFALRSKMSIDALYDRVDVGADRHVDKLEAYLDDLTRLGKLVSNGASTVELIRAIGVDIGLGANLEVLDRSKTSPAGSHADDVAGLEAIAGLHADVATFETWLRRTLAHGSVGDAERVTLASIHKVKGLEFDRVALIGVDDGLLPHRLADDTEEERRIFHVALTRAENEIVIYSDGDRPSPYVSEIDSIATKRPGKRKKRNSRVDRLHPRTSETVVVTAGIPDDPVSKLAKGISESLRDWRKTTAAEKGVPAYVVLQNKHIDDIAVRAPTNLSELARCNGIGPRRLEDYGDDILAVIEAIHEPD